MRDKIPNGRGTKDITEDRAPKEKNPKEKMQKEGRV